jgi:hypothetical protein
MSAGKELTRVVSADTLLVVFNLIELLAVLAFFGRFPL